MKQFIISRHRKTWSTEYKVNEFDTKEVVLRAIHHGGLKDRIDAHGADGAVLFSIKCRDLFGLTYHVVEVEGNIIGVLDREWSPPLLRIVDSRSEKTAYTVKVSPSLYEEFSLDLDGQAICLFRKASSFSDPLICCCLDDSLVSSNLMLAAGILILGQGPATIAGAAA